MGFKSLVWFRFNFTVVSYFQLDRTALHWAAANGHLQVMEMLINAGADIEAQDKVSI